MLPDAVERMDVICSFVLLLLKKKLLPCFSGSVVELFFTCFNEYLVKPLLLLQLESCVVYFGHGDVLRYYVLS